MRIVVAYDSKYGATTGIAEHVGERLRAARHVVDVRRVAEVADLDGYDAAVVGSAVYVGHWLPAARAFVAEHTAALAAMPTWLFSSGPLGTEPTDARGRDLREVAEPEEYTGYRETIAPRDATVFFGALVPSSLSFKDRSIRRLPVGRELLPQGDFRDWDAVDAWADGIVRDLQGASAGAS